jgi:hypothetical protein
MCVQRGRDRVYPRFRDKALSAVSQAGMVNNLNGAVAWGVFPLIFASTTCPLPRSACWPRSTRRCGGRSAAHRLVVRPRRPQAPDHLWNAAAGRRDRARKHPRCRGGPPGPARPRNRAGLPDPARRRRRRRPSRLAGTGRRVYRLWRDGGFAVGALLAGVLADAFGPVTAIWAVAALTAASGLVVAARMYETGPRTRPGPRHSPAEMTM